MGSSNEDETHYALIAQQQLNNYIQRQECRLPKMIASQVANYVDATAYVTTKEGETIQGKGTILERLRADHPDFKPENVTILADNAHKGGNDSHMMTIPETNCYNMKDRPTDPHIMSQVKVEPGTVVTTREGSQVIQEGRFLKLEKGYGSTIVLKQLLEKVKSNPEEKFIVLSDIDGTLTTDKK